MPRHEAALVRVMAKPTLKLLADEQLAAQGLKRAITSTQLFREQENESSLVLIVVFCKCRPVGFLKAGGKHLFYLSNDGHYAEIDPLCLLDFYADEAYQRQGIGLQLFSALLEHRHESAAKLAYDRPSPKLFAFLQKHAQLDAYTPQPNRFVVFDAYFEEERAPEQLENSIK